ncbi:MAG: alkaline phosphatase family protein [Nanoarchaeota archaeon]|nr:alkaline phosphatase family protein [Nanoarchaeota archaeon]
MKLIILGLDALNHNILEACKEDMPTLHKHLKEDMQGLLKTTLPNYTGSTWTSFQTGNNVGNHGIANFLKYDKHFNLQLLTGEDLKARTFYEIAHENNLKCFIMNLPYTYPPKIKGDIICSWLHVYEKIEDLFHPKSLSERYPSLKNYKNRANRSRSVIKYLNSAEEVLESQIDVVKEVLAAKEHDLSFFVIPILDMIQHKAFSDLIDKKINKKTVVCKRICQKLDLLIKWIDENKDEDAGVLIVSDHGFKVYEGKFFVNSWLKNQGYLKTAKDGIQLKEVVNRRQKKRGNIDISKLVVFIKKRPKMFKLLENFYDLFIRYCPFDVIKQPGFDIEKTKAYCRSTFESIIFFNEKITSKEKVKLKKELLNALNKVEGIEAHDCDEFYCGKYRKELGEIVIIPERFEIDSTIGDTDFLYVKRDMHSLNGIFMAYGKGIKKRCEVKDANIYDVVPTILHILGIPTPKDMDGKVLNIFDNESELVKQPIQFSETDRTEEEKELLRESIRDIKI